MATNLSEVADLFLSRVSDWRLDTIYSTSGSIVFGAYVEPWLFDAITEFENVCDQALTYTATSGSVTEGVFTETLSLENKVLLSQIMVLGWMAKGNQDEIQLRNLVTDRDFRTFSPAANINARNAQYNTKREEISQLLVNYGLRKNPWSDWRNQDFIADA
jgi:hypothetical protein